MVLVNKPWRDVALCWDRIKDLGIIMSKRLYNWASREAKSRMSDPSTETIPGPGGETVPLRGKKERKEPESNKTWVLVFWFVRKNSLAAGGAGVGLAVDASYWH